MQLRFVATIMLATQCHAFQPMAVRRPALMASKSARSQAWMQINQDGKIIDLSDETIYPKGPDGQVLITYASLDERARFDLEGALEERNRERILSGQPKYEDINAMIKAYIEYEGPGTDANLTEQQCEDAVMRFLQRKALMMEGGAEWNDPQTIVTFGLLALILGGGAFNVATGKVPLPF